MKVKVFFLLCIILVSPLNAKGLSSGPEDASLIRGESGDPCLYLNRFFSFDIEIPGGWHVIINNELQQFLTKSSEDKSFIQKQMEIGSLYLMSISKYPPGKKGPLGEHNPYILLGSSDLTKIPELKTFKNPAKIFAEEFARNKETIVDSSPIQLGGVDFWKVSRQGDRQIRHLESKNYIEHIVAIQKNYLLIFQIEADSKTEIIELEKILQTMFFDESVPIANSNNPTAKNEAEELIERGLYYSKKHKYDLSIRDYSEALKLDPKNVNAYIFRGNAYKNQGNYEQALGDYNSALAIDPKSAYAYKGRADTYEAKRDYDLVIKDCTKAIALSPNYAKAYNLRGSAYNLKNNHKKAITDFSKAIELQPDYILAHENRGKTYTNIGELDPAISDFNKCLEHKPDNARAYAGRGLAYAKKGILIEANKDFDKAIKLDPKDPHIYYSQGIAYRVQRKNQEAEECFLKALELDPKFTASYTNLGALYYDSRLYDQALRYYTKAIEAGSKLAVPIFGRGLSLQGLGEHDLATQEYTKACQRGYKPACIELKRMNNQIDNILKKPRSGLTRLIGKALFFGSILLLLLYFFLLRIKKNG